MEFRSGDVSKEQVEIAKKHIKHNCTKVLGVEVIEVDKVLEIMDNMFSLTSVKLPNSNAPHLTNLSYMFSILFSFIFLFCNYFLF